MVGSEECDPPEAFSCNVNCQFPICGNDFIDDIEECDGIDLGGQTCVSRGYAAGDLACEPTCIFNEDDCEAFPTCGDNFAGYSEWCDQNGTCNECVAGVNDNPDMPWSVDTGEFTENWAFLGAFDAEASGENLGFSAAVSTSSSILAVGGWKAGGYVGEAGAGVVYLYDANQTPYVNYGATSSNYRARLQDDTSFEQMTTAGDFNFGSGLAWGEFTGDTLDDLVTASAGSDFLRPIYVYAAASTWSSGQNVGTTTAGDVLRLASPMLSGVAAGNINGCGSELQIATGGDLDSDGKTDLLIGCDSGRTGVYLSSQLATITTGGFGGEALFTILHEVGGGAGVNAVSFLPDIDGDGYDEILVGRPSADNVAVAGVDNGRVDIILGKTLADLGDQQTSDNTLQGSLYDDVTYLTIWGTYDADLFGWSVGAGDIDNDGRGDLVVGSVLRDISAGSGDDEGGAHIIYGETILDFVSNSGVGADVVIDDITRTTLTGEGVNDQAGAIVRGVGNVDGDDFDDILVTAVENDDGGVAAGKVYVVRGATINGVSGNAALNAVKDVSFIGEATDDVLGRAGSSVFLGDVDGDGRDDILMGAHHNDQGGGSSTNCCDGAGKAYVWISPY